MTFRRGSACGNRTSSVVHMEFFGIEDDSKNFSHPPRMSQPIRPVNLENLFSQGQSNKSSLQVYVRIKPSLDDGCIHPASDTSLTLCPPSSKTSTSSAPKGSTASFTRVFGPQTLQETYFEATTAPLVDQLVRQPNYHSVVMAYGITAAGKTYTIEGTLDSPGLIPLAMARLFDTLQHLSDTTTEASIPPIIEVSYCEIYNESIYDLLAEQPPVHRQQLRLVDAEGRVEVAGLVRICIQSLEQGVAVLQRGSRARARGGTGLNLSSSRSHSIFTLTLRDPLGRKTSSQRRLAFVDLAGSERVQRTGNVGVRLKESVAINASLMTLGRCLEALAWNQQQQQQKQKQLRVVPYRESKITHLFRDALHGYGTVVLSVNVSPAASDFDETVHVLRYASLATGIETTSCVDSKNKAPFKKRVTKADKAPALLRRRLLKAAASAKRKKRNGKSPLSNDCGAQVNSNQLSNGSLSTPLPSPQSSHHDPGTVQELQAQVQQLIKDLQAAEERAVLVEAEVREEVALEMGELLREMEDRYKERVAMEVAAAEGRLESRMQQMQQMQQRLRETEEALRIAQTQLESQEREWKQKETGDLGHGIYLEHRIQEEITQKEANAAMELGMAEREIERLRKEIVSLKSQLSMVTSALEAVASPTIPLTSRLAACSAGNQDEAGQAGATPHEIALHRALKALHAVDDEEKEDGREVKPATTNTRARSRSRLAKCTSVHYGPDTESIKIKTKEKELKKRSKPALRRFKKKQTLQELDPNEGDGAHSSRSSSNPKGGTIGGTGTLPENGQDVLPMKSVEPKSVKRRLLGVSRAGLESIVSPNTLYSPFVRASPYSREGRL